MDDNRILMCMPYRQFVSKAVDAGFSVYSIWDPTLASPEYLQDVVQLSEQTVFTDFSNENELRRVVAETARRYGTSRVLHLGRESSQMIVYREADRMGLAVNSPESVQRINDKAVMRRLLQEGGLSPVRSLTIPSPTLARDQMPRFGFPAVIKPTRLDGSQGVWKLESSAGLDGWLEEVSRCDYHGPVLIEEYLHGPEFSVETLTVDGTHHLIGITAKRLGPPPRFVETGHIHPAPLHDGDHEAIAALVTAFLDATGYRFGPAHTEVILTEAGPRIVESQARLGGDRIPLLIEVASGFDIEASIFKCLAGRPLHRPHPRRFGCIAFFDFGTGFISRLDGADEVGRLPFVHAFTLKHGVGDELPAVVNSQTRHGYVVIDAESEGEADARIATVHGLLHVETAEPTELICQGAATPTRGLNP